MLNEILDTVLLIDCIELLKKLPDNTIDFIITSPPYNIGKEYEEAQDLEQYLLFQKTVIKECYRILKDTGTIFWQVADYVDKKTSEHIPLDIIFFPLFKDLGMHLINRIIWIKDHGLHGKKRFSCRFETALWLAKSKNYTFNLDFIRVPQKWPNKTSFRDANYGEKTCNELGKNPGDVWAFGNVRHNHEEQTIHPAQFPEDLVERMILCATNENDIVLDPFMGSGTTAVVAKNFNRHFLGSEIVKEYVDLSNQRISGLPDGKKCFVNLKNLRDYCLKMKRDPKNYSFARQTSKTPSIERKITPEQVLLDKFIKRLKIENDDAVYKKVQDEQY